MKCKGCCPDCRVGSDVENSLNFASAVWARLSQIHLYSPVVWATPLGIESQKQNREADDGGCG